MVPEIQLARGFLAHLWQRHSVATTARAQRLRQATLLLASQTLSAKRRQQAILDAFRLTGSLSTFGAEASSQRAHEIGTAFLRPSRVNTSEAAQLHSACLELLDSVQHIAESFSRV